MVPTCLGFNMIVQSPNTFHHTILKYIRRAQHGKVSANRKAGRFLHERASLRALQTLPFCCK